MFQIFVCNSEGDENVFKFFKRLERYLKHLKRDSKSYAFKTFQKRSKHFERDTTLDVALVCDSHDDRFLQTAQISLKRCRFPYISLKRLKLLMNVPDFLKTLMISADFLKTP